MPWYWLKGRDRLGPMSFADLRDRVRRGELGREDWVWHPEFGPEWKPAAQVESLFDSPGPGPAGPAGGRLSVRMAVRDAWRWTGELLWNPVIPGRWFSLGFCAWLMTLGKGGCGGTTGFPGGPSGKGDASGLVGPGGSLSTAPGQFAEWVREVVAPLSGVILVFLLAGLFLLLFAALLLAWLRSRGVFMFMCRLENKHGTIGEAWSDAAGNAERLFAWKVLFGGFSLILLAGPAAWGIVRALGPSGTPSFDALARMLAGPVALFALAGLAVGLVAMLASDFLEPVMFWQRSGLRTAWITVARFVMRNPGAVVRFELLKIGLALLAGTAVIAACLLSCFLGAVLLLLPYIGAVVLLPVTVFFRTYGMSFLRQWEGLKKIFNPPEAFAEEWRSGEPGRKGRSEGSRKN